MPNHSYESSEELRRAQRIYLFLKAQVDTLRDSNLPEPLLSVCELLLRSQWLEFQAKELATDLIRLPTNAHDAVKLSATNQIDKVHKMPEGRLIELLEQFEMRDIKQDKIYKQFLHDFNQFKDARNKYTHHYFVTKLTARQLRSELKSEIKKSIALSDNLSQIRIFVQRHIARDLLDELRERIKASPERAQEVVVALGKLNKSIRRQLRARTAASGRMQLHN